MLASSPARAVCQVRHDQNPHQSAGLSMETRWPVLVHCAAIILSMHAIAKRSMLCSGLACTAFYHGWTLRNAYMAALSL